MAACTRLISLELHQQVVLQLAIPWAVVGQVVGLASCVCGPLLLAQGWNTLTTIVGAVWLCLSAWRRNHLHSCNLFRAMSTVI